MGLATIAAAPACHIEWDRYEITDLVIFDVTADLDDLAGDLMPQDHAHRGCSAASNHVLVGSADVRRDDLEYDAVNDRFPCRIAEGWKVDVSNLDLARSEIDNATIGGHLEAPFPSSRIASWRNRHLG
jgi:hypothetical protein